MKKTVAVVLLCLIMVGLLICVYPVKAASNTVADAQSVSMPMEYINCTVDNVQGSPWASVDGTYPIEITSGLVGQELQMVYPMPSGVTNISVELNGKEESYSNLTESFADMVHYTYLGEWQMIFFIIQPSSSDFNLTVHYQQPILLENGTDIFLYNLNISPYLSNASSESTAQFNILFQTRCSGIKVFTVPGQGAIPLNDTRTPVNFTVSKGNSTQTVAFSIISNYSDQPRDELVTFHESQTQVPEFPSWTILLSLIIMVAVASLFVYFKKHKRQA
jgi:hypothetical protein